MSSPIIVVIGAGSVFVGRPGIINNIQGIEAIMHEIFERQRDGLDPRWYA